jgi:phosphoribosylanthranilate isomerase
MKTQTKICGLSTLEAGRTAIDAGAAFLGFIHFAKSPRHLTLEAMAALMGEMHAAAPLIKCVCVVVDPDDALLQKIADVIRPDLIQLHGHESPERVADIATRFKIPLIKAISVETAADVAAAMVYEPHVAHLMFDAKPPKEAALPGGMGLSFDWRLLEGLKVEKPWFLAGGLHPSNVAEALRLTKAPMVDVSSGVETSPGLKDASLIHAFLETVDKVNSVLK